MFNVFQNKDKPELSIVDAPLEVVPGQSMPLQGNIILNKNRRTISLKVTSTCDRPIQVSILKTLSSNH